MGDNFMNKIEIINNEYVMFGCYPQNGYEKEPIKWVVIKKEDNVVTLMPDKILTNFMYDRYFSEYKSSAIRKFIHEQFIPIAFSEEELEMILPTKLEDDVIDKVFLPSVDDIKDLSFLD